MAEIDLKIIVEIKNYIKLHGEDYPSWYVGLAEHPEEELIAHGVNLDLDRYIFLTAASPEDARSIELYFAMHLRTDGNSRDSVDEKAQSVYAYRKTASTHP